MTSEQNLKIRKGYAADIYLFVHQGKTVDEKYKRFLTFIKTTYDQKL